MPNFPKREAQESTSEDYRVFISHATEDEKKAAVIRKALLKAGIEAFMFEGEIPAGEEFARKIRDELQRCSEFCLLWTNNSQQSQWVLFETGGAYALGRRITPILDGDLQADSLPQALQVYHCLPLFNITEYIEQVRKRIRDLQESRRLPPDEEVKVLISGHPPRADWQVIAHCDDQKWWDATFPHAPGRELRDTLSGYGVHVEIEVVSQFEHEAEHETAILSSVQKNADVVFLIDSPRSNPLVREVMNTYRQWVAYGSIRFELCTDSQSGFCYEKIVVGSTTYRSDKYWSQSTRECLVGQYLDYFAALRLPGDALNVEGTDAKVWVLCGIHAKGTWVLTRVFERANVRRFFAEMQKMRAGTEMPEYFEAVFEVRRDLDDADVKSPDFCMDSVKCVHFAPLLSRKDSAMNDPMDMGFLPRFCSESQSRLIPLQIVHIDPVRGCNFACPGCIETPLRERRLFLSLTKLLQILNSLKRCGCKWIGFYGGEPTMHPQFSCLLETAVSMGFEVSLVTNGSLLDLLETKKAIVENRDRLQVRVSVDANTEGTHAWVHGKKADGTLAKITKTTKDLIERGVFVSISYRLHPKSSGYEGNVFEAGDACRFWKENGAQQFALRPMTGIGGETPLSLSNEELQAIQHIGADSSLHGFLSLPEWIERVATPGAPLRQQKEYDKCYSAFYRVVVSPWLGEALRNTLSTDLNLTETHCAWMSLCSYRRFHPDFGLPFPDDLGEWMNGKRTSDIARIRPCDQCQNVLCCRDSYNRKVHMYLTSQKCAPLRPGKTGPQR